MKIYIVTKNADFTEGRGPMLFHAAFITGEAAVEYVLQQQGIFGSAQRVEMGKYGHYAKCNGYNIDEHYLYSASDIETLKTDQERKYALSKLSARERSLLGLD